eukprot:575009-Prorocentrum_minimum.AAC.2
MTQLKLKGRFEFPHLLNVKAYTVEGLAEAEKAAAAAKASQNGGGGKDDNGDETDGPTPNESAPDVADQGGQSKGALKGGDAGSKGVAGMVEGDAGAGGQGEGGGGDAVKAEDEYEYELVGVVVHSGTAFAVRFFVFCPALYFVYSRYARTVAVTRRAAPHRTQHYTEGGSSVRVPPPVG